MERIRQSDNREITHPTFVSAENLELPRQDPNNRRYRTLALFEKRRLSNMPPPTVREISRYLDECSTSVVNSILSELTHKGYLTDWSNSDNKTHNRAQTMKVNFETIKMPNGDFARESSFKEMDGITMPKSSTSVR